MDFSLVIKNWLRRAEVDSAIIFALSSRIVQIIVGPVTLLLIARCFTPQMQGFYYTFSSLIAFQSFVELGLYLVVINIASHEWVHLSINKNGHIVGKPEALSRLVSLGHFIFKWYSVASLVFVIVLGSIGYVFISISNQHDYIKWQAPWISLVLLTGLVLLTMPFTSLLEGCNQVVAVNKFRVYQAIYSSLALWLILLIGGGLWALVVLAGVNLLCNLYLQLIKYRKFFKPFFSPPVGPVINWKLELWPMQWRLGSSGLVNYFAFSIFTPVMFYYHGAIVAGQMGMTLQIICLLQSMALVWVHTKVPRYGMFIAQKDYVGLDKFWLRCSLVSLFVICIGAVIIWSLVFGLNLMQISFSQRLLSPLPTGLFLIAFILIQILQCQVAYLRAHKQEPIIVASVTTCIFSGFSVWLLGRRFGPIGASAGFLLIMLISTIWINYIWSHCRKVWHETNLRSA